MCLHFFCRSIHINKREYLSWKGPLILAANHPNSFLDAIILAALFCKPVYSLARGDAFVSTFVTRLLESFNMLPVYRISEGAENLGHNYDTFGRVEKLLLKKQIVLVFSEGRCINEWHLRPLKKGTARMAFSAWQNDIPLKVLPVGINYSNFGYFGKNVIINFGDIIDETQIEGSTQGKGYNTFNDLLKKQLSNLVFEIPKDDIEKRKLIFEIPTSRSQKVLLAIPAAIGYILHAPFFYAAHFIIRKTAKDHYDSIMVGIMFIFYPAYLLIITLIVFFISNNYFSVLLLLMMPLCALALLHSRKVVS